MSLDEKVPMNGNKNSNTQINDPRQQRKKRVRKGREGGRERERKKERLLLCYFKQHNCVIPSGSADVQATPTPICQEVPTQSQMGAQK